MALIVARVWRVNAAAIVRSIPFVVNGRREPSAGECRSDFSYGKHCFPWVHRRRTRRRSSAVGVPLVIAHQSTGTVSLSPQKISSRGTVRATRSRHRRREIGLSLCVARGPCEIRHVVPSLSEPGPRSYTNAIRHPRVRCHIVKYIENTRRARQNARSRRSVIVVIVIVASVVTVVDDGRHRQSPSSTRDLSFRARRKKSAARARRHSRMPSSRRAAYIRTYVYTHIHTAG